MPPSLGLMVWAALLLGLFCCDPAREPKTSAALWLPVIWLFLLGSRIPSNWLGLSYVSDAVQALELLVRRARSVGVARLDGDNVLEAHNGYLAFYLDLGLISLCLLCTFLIATYRKICKRLEPFTPRGSLGLRFWAVLVFYNITEAGFEVDFLFVSFLLAAIPMSGRSAFGVRPSKALSCARVLPEWTTAN